MSVDNVSQLRTTLDQIHASLGPTQSIQFMFAALQLAQSQICKTNATQYMNQITDIQKEQSETAEMIKRARDLQAKAASGEGDCSWDDKASVMPQDMIDWMDARGIPYDKDGNDAVHNEEEWSFNIQSLTDHQESISNKTQTLMVYLQDFIGQYNSYLQGANSAIQQANQVLTSIATGR